MQERTYGGIRLKIFDTRKEMGETAAREAAEQIRALLRQKKEINCVFAAAPSQNEFLAALAGQDIPWERIHAYHMDEYVGFEVGDPKSFNGFLSSAIFRRVPFASVHLIDGRADPLQECERYAALLKAAPPDIVFLGIGENGHIAFNDPGAADFKDPKAVKVVKLEEVCRLQQVHDKCFATLADVPKQAITLTIPTLVSAPYLFCIVPGERKAKAVADALTGEIGESCPASILRLKKGCRMYLDKASAAGLQ
ncbi:MAG TPA: glucosamine-6-phosphate deaminase [Ruminococcaceae bacterium]|nr:glucosamine-6-phosphate deaminase [Oscillospiraceae bacterium]